MSGSTAANHKTKSSYNTSGLAAQSGSTDASAAEFGKMTSSGSKAAEQQQQSGANNTSTTAKPPAWSRSSINPITQRASGSSPVQNGVKSNGTTPNPSNAVKPAAAAASASSKDVGSQDRLMFLFAHFKGLHATLLLRNGDRYTGIFSGVSNGQYIVKMGKKLPSHGKHANGITDENVGSGPDRTLALSMQDVVDLSVNEVRFDKTQSHGQNGVSTGFRTDTDISAGRRGRERELQKWEPTDGPDVDHSIENGSIGGWDQFAAHKKMTGLESTYDENNYTTALNKSRPDYDEAMRKADQIAREIEGSSATNAHIAEERGIKAIDDSGLDEEAKYSGVQREVKPLASGSANRYTPPAMRAPTGQATVPGAPVDPAIISSAFADSSKSKPAPASAAKKVEETPSAAKEEAAKPAPTTRPAAEKMAIPITTPAVPAPLPSARVANLEGGATATVEKDVHEAFKEFTKSEKLKVQEHQRSLARRDKAVKLNDLKKFAQNFKLHTEVPADLLPILARDEIKQRAIKEKAKKNAEDNKSTPPRSTATSVAATPADTKSKPNVGRNDSGPTSPLASVERQTQRSRQSSTNVGGSSKAAPQHMQGGQNQGHRQHGNLGPRLAMNTQMNRGGMPQFSHPMPIPDPRMGQANIVSPTGTLRWDPTKSFVPSAASKPFVPGGSNASTGSSPTRAPSSQPAEPKAPTPGSLFEGRVDGRKGPVPDSERPTLDNYYNPIPTLIEENKASLPEAKRSDPPDGGLPPPHKTMPTWESLVPEANRDKTYKDMFPSALKPAASPQQHMGSNQFQHQLPYAQHHPNFAPQASANQTPRHMVAQPHHVSGGPNTPQHHYEEAQRMQFSQSTSGAHSSPRPMQNFVYGAQPGPLPHGQPGFGPQMVYGSSPSAISVGMGGYPMAVRQLSGNPGFHHGPSAGQQHNTIVSQGGPPPGAMYMPNGAIMYPATTGGPGQAFFAHPVHQGQQGMQNGGFPSPGPAARAAMMVQQGSQNGHSTPGIMGPFYGQGPVQQMRYAGPPQHHNQHQHQHPYQAGGPPHYPQQGGGQHVMRGVPGGSYNLQQQAMTGQQPQAMMMGQQQGGPEGAEDAK